MIIIILIIIITLVVLFFVWKWNIEYAYKNIESEAETANVKRFIALSRLKPNKSSLDYYRMGCVLDYVYKSPQKAADLYKAAISAINIERPTKTDQFVLNKLADRVELDVFLEVDEEPIQPYFMKYDVPEPSPNIVEVEEKINWEPDYNNVHDTNINGEVVEKINKIRSRVRAPMNFEIARGYILTTEMPDFEKPNLESAKKTLEHISTYNQLLSNANICEKDLIGYVVSDIKDNYTSQRQQIIMENLVNNLKDSNSENGGVVCINGRISRILNSYTDGEEETFKTNQVWKNELFENAKKAKERVLESLSANEREIYNSDTPGPILEKINNEISGQMMAAVAISNAPPKVISEVSEELKYCI